MNKMMLKKQYMMYAPKKKGRLPSDYQEVEYIESTGTQYIDTNIKVSDLSSAISMAYRFMPLNELTTSDSYYLGTYGAYPNYFMQLSTRSNISSIYFYCGNPEQGGEASFTRNNWQNYEQYLEVSINGTSGNVSLNGIQKTFSYAKPTINGSLYIGALNNNGSATINSKTRIYEFSFKDDGKLIRNLIPCYRKSDNEVGLYDLVNGVFYTNQGSGEFSCGVDIVNIDGYKQLDYIGGNNAYIEFPYVTNGYNIGFDISFDVPRTSLTQDTPIIQNDWLSNWVPLGMSLTDKNKTYFGSYSMASNPYRPYWTNDTYTYNEDRYLINYKNSNVISSVGKSNWSHTLNKSLNDVAITYFTFMSVGVPSTFHLKALDMTDGDKIVARFIPMEETNTGLVGLYDLVGKKFYSSQTNNNFIKGDYI